MFLIEERKLLTAVARFLPSEDPGVYGIEAVKLFDGKISVRIDNEEVHLLPSKLDCTVEDIDRMVRAVAKRIDKIWPESEPISHDEVEW